MCFCLMVIEEDGKREDEEKEKEEERRGETSSVVGDVFLVFSYLIVDTIDLIAQLFFFC